ncbi:PX domain-containing protein ypt35 [Oleoguttula sp. CCFEE 5521]
MGSSPPLQDGRPDTRTGSTTLDANDVHTSSAPSSPSSDLHTSPRASSDSSPPFWLTRHDRSISTVSYQSIVETRPAPISLEDHSSASHEQSLGCWARSVTVDDYVIVSGPTGIGAYLVWNCSVATLKGGVMSIRKRYSEFDKLRNNLIKAFPYSEASIPPLPRKSVVSRFRPEFLEHRKNGLNHFMNCILLNPEFAASPILKDFIFF